MAPLRSVRLVLSLCLLALLVGCAQKSPEQRVAEARAKYTVDISACVPQAPAEAQAAPDEGTTDDDASSADLQTEEGEQAQKEEVTDATEMADEPLEPPAPAVTTILCDVLVRYDGHDPLPGVTLDLSHVGADGTTKTSFREYVETAGLMRGDTRQVALTLEVPDFHEGDQISLDPIRADIPAAERSEYREYAESGK